MKEYKSSILIIILFCSLFYYSAPFQYGSGNNVEELPMIYKVAGFAEYEQDPLVQISLSQFNAGSIFVYTMGFIGSVVGIEGMPFIYFMAHLFTLVLLCFSIIRILKSLRLSTGHSYLIVLLTLLIFNHYLHLIPNQRSLFWSYLDPEFVVATILFFSISAFIEDHLRTAAFFLFIGTLLHPLYALPIGGAYIVISLLAFFKNKTQALSKAGLYFICIIPYSVLLLYLSHQQIDSIYDVSLLHEFVRAPHHLTIPGWGSGNVRQYLRFFGSTFFMLVLSYLLWKQNSTKRQTYINFIKDIFNSLSRGQMSPFEKLASILFILMLYLGLASLVASFVRIPILVQLTPYRIGLFVVVLLVCVLSSLLNEFVDQKKIKASPKWLFYVLPLLLTGLIFQTLDFKSNINHKNRLETIGWINETLPRNSLFLNYSDIDVRTDCLRSDFFVFKSIPLNTNGQIDWYERLLIYYDIPEEEFGLDYKKVASKIKDSQHKIHVYKVLNKTSLLVPQYLLFDINQPIVGYEGYDLIFEKGDYKIYHLIK